jgi:hypothetical protein
MYFFVAKAARKMLVKLTPGVLPLEIGNSGFRVAQEALTGRDVDTG